MHRFVQEKRVDGGVANEWDEHKHDTNVSKQQERQMRRRGGRCGTCGKQTLSSRNGERDRCGGGPSGIHLTAWTFFGRMFGVFFQKSSWRASGVSTLSNESSRQNASSHVKNAHARLSGGSTSPHLALAKKNTPHLTLAKKTAPHLALAKKTTPHLTLAKLNLTSPHPANCRVMIVMSECV